MTLDPAIKKVWIEIQKKSARPVNAIGLEIEPRDQATLEVWKREGIDQFRKR
ncbi:MAG: hypothetical protein AAF657_24250 [Acidobacteriota bacterium]